MGPILWVISQKWKLGWVARASRIVIWIVYIHTWGNKIEVPGNPDVRYFDCCLKLGYFLHQHFLFFLHQHFLFFLHQHFCFFLQQFFLHQHFWFFYTKIFFTPKFFYTKIFFTPKILLFFTPNFE